MLVIHSAELTRDTEFFGKMDPFVTLVSEHLKLRTQVHENGGKKPVWEKSLNIDPDYLGDEVKFTCMDQDLTKTDLIGECIIPKSTFLVEGDHALTNFDLLYKGKKAGVLKLMWRCTKKTTTDKLATAFNKNYGL